MSVINAFPKVFHIPAQSCWYHMPWKNEKSGSHKCRLTPENTVNMFSVKPYTIGAVFRLELILKLCTLVFKPET